VNPTTSRWRQVAGLFALGLATAPSARAAEVDFEGYYRARAHVFSSLSIDPQADNYEGVSGWIEHRVWLRPRFLINDKIGVFAEIKGFDNLVWGNEPHAWFDPSIQLDVPLVLTDELTAPVTTDDERAPLVDITLWRAWGEVHVGDHKFLVGRMPLNWGQGVWQNDGLGYDGEYGDTVDRVQWEGLFNGQIYGSLAFDVNRKGLLAAPDGTFSVYGMAAVRTEVVTAGVNLQYRRAVVPDAGVDPFDMFTGDVALRASFGPIQAKLEALVVFGGGDLESLNDARFASGGGVVDLKALTPQVDVGFRFALATGDGNPNDSRIKTFQFDRDYNFGIIMFEQPMPLFEAPIPTDENGGRDDSLVALGPTMSNAMVFVPEVSRDLGAGFRVGLLGVMAPVAKVPDLLVAQERRYYGTEVDLKVGYTGLDHLDVQLTGALYAPGGYVQRANDLDLGGIVFGSRLNITIGF